MNKISTIVGLLFFTLLNVKSFSQSSIASDDKSWHLNDKNESGIYGISLEKAYNELLKNINPKKKVIVAIIDSGVDTLHEDLKSVLWKNKKEIPGNNVDDDKNGFTDDIYGWNFLGGKDGRNVTKDSYEGARIYYNLKSKFENKPINETTLSSDDLIEFRNYKKTKSQIESQAKEASMYVMILKDIVAKLPYTDSVLQKEMNKAEFTGDELEVFKPQTAEGIKAKASLLGLYQQTRQMEMSNTRLVNELMSFYDGQKTKLELLEKGPENYRQNIVKDNYNDPLDRYYGNNDVMATGADHGTHVAGIIGAIRTNKVGMSGVANNVELMILRAVPDGDEHDKDIANAIRYAVDNGAWVINMSFGKSFSPEKKWVDEAVKYAESKNVLLVHAAGNDSKNIDTEDNFPSGNLDDDTLRSFSNWITVGASGSTIDGLAAGFSNYGKREVDVFAPGVEIYSTLPGGNKYGKQDGTSMASPVVAGLAALLLSYYPELSAIQIKQIIEESAYRITDEKIVKPGTENEKVNLNDLSKTGGIVNAYNAIKLAQTYKGERKTQSGKTQSIKK
jgi:subtilisin family serine protease